MPTPPNFRPGTPSTGPVAGELIPGTPYRIVRRLGQGGMGEVFLVVHDDTGGELAVKILHRSLAGDPQLLERIRLEAHTLGKFYDDNPHVVRVTDYRIAADGRPIIVTEYLKGRTLHEELGSGRAMSLFDAVDFMHQALSGLVGLHALGVVHRDMKPDNLFLCEGPDGVITVKLLDFGLVKVIPGISSDAPRPLAFETETGAVLGTPRYLSPEAALGKRVDFRADLYSLAVVFYEMVAGRGPFEHLKHDYLMAHTVEDPEPPSHYAKRPVPRQFDEVILRGLQKHPDGRYQTAEQFQLALEGLWELINSPTAPAMDPPQFQTTGQLRRPQLAPPVSSPAAAPAPWVPSDTSTQARNRRPRATPAQIAASVIIVLVTALAVSSLVVAVLRRMAS